jgi:ferrous iron transport protein B
MAGSAAVHRFGLSTEGSDYVVALAGNPNTGKSTVFNALTGLRQHVGNWPGKTVTRAEGAFMFAGRKFRIVDLPGTYSLLSNSSDEEVARDFILFGKPDVTVVVADATALERNLNLALQVLEITDRAVLAVNLMDEARRKGIRVDDRALARDLGVPVVPMAARSGRGMDGLRATILGVASGEIVCRPKRAAAFEPEVEHTIARMRDAILGAYPGLPNARWVALRLLEGDPNVIREARAGTLGTGLHDHSVAQQATGAPTAHPGPA